jgi:hypothetical protein
MSAKIIKASTAAQRKLAIRRWRKWAVQFEVTVARELKKAPNGAATGLVAVVVGNFDKTTEYIQIFHPGGPPAVFKNIVVEE